MQSYNLVIYASYFQFVVKDINSKEDISYLWNEGTARDLFVVGNEVIVVGTARDQMVPVSVEITENFNQDDDYESFDQVIECGIPIPSGKLIVMGIMDYLPDVIPIVVLPGYYGIRVYYEGLNTISSDGLGGDDKYKVVLNRTENIVVPRFLKRKCSQTLG